MGERISIYIVAFNKRVRKDLEQLLDKLEFDASPETVFSDAESFLEDYSIEKPACLIAEFLLPGMNGLELQESLLNQRGRIPIIFVTDRPVTPQIVRAIKNGAITVLEMPMSVAALWEAIENARQWYVTTRRVDSLHAESRSRLARLSVKERQVLDLMLKGKVNKTIGRELDVSTRTVESRRKEIFRKTKTSSLAELLQLVWQTEEGGDDTTFRLHRPV